MLLILHELQQGILKMLASQMLTCRLWGAVLADLCICCTHAFWFWAFSNL